MGRTGREIEFGYFRPGGLEATVEQVTINNGQTVGIFRELKIDFLRSLHQGRDKIELWPKNGIRRDEVIQPPFSTGLGIDAFASDGEIFLTLPDGERFIIDKRPDARDGGFPRRLSEGLRSALLLMEDDFADSRRTLNERKYQAIGKKVLNRQFGFNSIEAEYWARKLLEMDPSFDRIFPHWVSVSILAAAKFAGNYRFSRPKFATIEPAPITLREFGLDKAGLLRFRQKTPPVLTGTAAIFLGNFGSVLYPSDRPEYLMLRRNHGRMLGNKYVFPGGRTDNLLEITAWQELREEMPFLIDTDDCEKFRIEILGVDFLAVVDQTLINQEGQLRRSLDYTFAFWVSNSNETALRGIAGDDQGEWLPVKLDPDSVTVSDSVIKKNLSPIAAIALRAATKIQNPRTF
ncbi:MAG TPA: hypothetical protein VMW41_01305 [Candidatus Bathyarchaeia archaeon]|nr:hypothetical protein [Candidatus Bathyarchaeia archaeon]